VRAFFALCAAVSAVAATASPAPAVEGACPMTVANGLMPPGAPVRQDRQYGNGRLSTAADGRITRTPDADGSISWKWMWWGTREPRQPLRITGRRLDALAPLMAMRVHERFVASAIEGYVEGSPPGIRFWSSSVTFPTEGCWRVTGVVGRVRLSFVVFIQAVSPSAQP
jgi:hypothetical protein